jgi:hypothetical protein
VDLRCYGLTSPRRDGKLSVHFNDIDNFYYEWDIEALPWDAVTPFLTGENHPDALDQKLINAIIEGPLGTLDETKKSALAASLAFLYMYMVLAHDGERYVRCHRRGRRTYILLMVDRRSISPRDQPSPSGQASAHQRPFRLVQQQLCYYFNDGFLSLYLRLPRLLTRVIFISHTKADVPSRRR